LRHTTLVRLRGALVPALLLCLAPGAALSQAASPAKPAAKPMATPAPPPPLEPAALDRLKAMSELLKSARSFTFKVVTDREQHSVNGQLLNFFTESKVEVSRPNHVRVQTTGDRLAASLWYDGKTVSIYSDKSSFYGETAAPATIDETLQMLMDRFAMPIPVAGFLLQDPYARMMDGVRTAFEAGVAPVDGVDCLHLAFSEEEADWQVWIQQGAKPLPRRIAVTYKKAPGAPHIMAALSDWNLAPTIPAGAFTFVPPPGAKKVDWKTFGK
jgi:hypothetical protein